MLWLCALALCSGFVLWLCALALCSGFVLWLCSGSAQYSEESKRIASTHSGDSTSANSTKYHVSGIFLGLVKAQKGSPVVSNSFVTLRGFSLPPSQMADTDGTYAVPSTSTSTQ